MLNQSAFDNYRAPKDEYADMVVDLRLNDLLPAFKGKPKITYLISTYNRRCQLSRSLETLARQTFRKFEVIIVNDGSTQDLNPTFEMFRPYLQLQIIHRPRSQWTSCPSGAYKEALPKARGEIIAIAHPEMMLDYEAMEYIYKGCRGELSLDQAHYWTIGQPGGPERWVSLKPLFLDDIYKSIDTVNWHQDIKLLQTLPGFWEAGGFSSFPNSWHAAKEDYPWWFVGATRKEASIWRDMPVFRGHGIIDMWLCDHRRLNDYIEVTPRQPMCYHQPHARTAVGLQGEQDDRSRKARRVTDG